MHLVVKRLKFIEPESYELAVGCSGGLDSTVLIHACLILGLKPTLLHVNYHLRGEDSDQDEHFLRKLAKSQGLQIEVKDCPHSITKGQGINLQAAARQFRHDFFQEWLTQSENRRLLLAHHCDDQVETFFLQLARGSGLFGLGGMHLENNRIIRPFLSLSKKELVDFAKQEKLTWREDSSNSESDYARNKLRNIILPELLKSHPNLVTSVTFLQEKFRENQLELARDTKEKLAYFVQQGEIDFKTWNTFNLESKILVFKNLSIPLYLIDRINDLEESELSASLNADLLIRTKHGFSWHSQFPFKNTWEFKSESIGILPQVFTNASIYLDLDKLTGTLEFSFAENTDAIQKPGNTFKSNVFELMKECGIPKQWRTSFPVLKHKNEVIWIPTIAVDARYLADNSSTNIQKVYIK